MRKPTKDLLRWCLRQSKPWTQSQAAEEMGTDQSDNSKYFRELESLGLIKREKVDHRQCIWTIADRARAQGLVYQTPARVINSVWEFARC